MSTELVTVLNPKSPIAEAYRSIRTNIQFASIDKNLKTICITSTGPSEGKTTTSSNLAEVFRQSGCKVLLIDGDLRKPRIHKIFNLSNSRGLTNALVGQINIEESIQETTTGLSVMTSGPIPPNPSELIASKKMKQLLEALEEKFDFIIIDAPPVGIVTDSAVFSTFVDGVLLVVASGRTNIEEGKRAKALLDNVHANIIGIIMTMIPMSKKEYYGYRYYGEEQKSPSKFKKRK